MIGSLAASVQSIGTTLTNLSTEFVESVVDNRLCMTIPIKQKHNSDDIIKMLSYSRPENFLSRINKHDEHNI